MIITRVEDKEVIGFVRTGDAISDEHVLLMKGRLVVSNSVAAYSSTNIDTAPVWSFGKCLRVSGFLLSFVLYKKVVWEEIEWLAREHPGCSDYVLRATAAMQGDFLAVPEAVLVRSMQPYEYYGEVEAQKALFEIA